MLQELKRSRSLDYGNQDYRGDVDAVNVETISLEQLLAMARRQALVVALVSSVALLAGAVYLITVVPRYTAVAEILIDSKKTGSIADLVFDKGAIDSQLEILKSEKVALSVISALNLTRDPEFKSAPESLIGQVVDVLRGFSGWPEKPEKPRDEDAVLARAAIKKLEDNLRIDRVGNTYVIAVYYTSPNRDKAATIANAFAKAYLTDQLDAKIDVARGAAAWFQTQLAELRQKSAKSDFAIQKFKADNSIDLTNNTLVQLRLLQGDADADRTAYETLMKGYQAVLEQQASPASEARIITSASPPESASYPKRGLIMGLSLIIGAIIGTSLGALREHRDRALRMASQVNDEMGIEFLGMLEDVAAQAVSIDNTLVARQPTQICLSNTIQSYSIDHPLSIFTETLRSVKVALDQALGDRSLKVIGVVSAFPNEGKTTVAKNFASLLADIGARTVLIDGDLRSAGLTKAIALGADAGILEAIQGKRSVQALLLTEPESGLCVLPAVIKEPVHHPTEVLSQMCNVVLEAGKACDYIVIDLPPMALVADTRAVASLCDAFLFVAEWGRTPRAVVKNILNSEPTVLEKCIGILFNKVNLGKVNLYESHASKHHYYHRFRKYYTNNLV
jgi:Mrp family chromosome partitioning ATPase/capsular polysaccharide biosynthesis protein